MGLITRPNTYTAGNTIDPTENTSNETTLYNLVNGNIDNDNIKSAAGILESKIAFNTSTGHSHNGVDSRLIKSVAQLERMRYNVLSTGTNVVPRLYNKSGLTLTISGIYIYAHTAPTGDDIIVDVNKDGTTIFGTTPANRPTIAAGDNDNTPATPDTTSWADDSYLTFDIDQVGSTIPGADLLIVVYF